MKTGNTREFLYENIVPKNSVCAEIGVSNGENADRILEISKPEILYLIDLWDNEEGIKNHFPPASVNRQLTHMITEWPKIIEKYGNRKNVTLLKEASTTASKQFEDNYFDWVYIDALHTYDALKEDIKSWYPKVKQGGYLCGHDYKTEKHKGVERAVDEFLKENNLEMYYMGINRTPPAHASEWCILKK